MNNIYPDFEKKFFPGTYNTNLFKTTKEIIKKNTPNHISAAKYIKYVQEQASINESLKNESENPRKLSNKGRSILTIRNCLQNLN